MNKKLTIFLIFIVLLVGISCVSAEDMDDIGELSTGDTADEIISVDESLDDNIGIDESDAQVRLGNPTPVNSWSDLASAVSGSSGSDVVSIESNLTPGTQITINHDVTIVGSADTYIGGSSSSNAVSYSDILFLSTTNGLSITLKNIKFQNCGGNTLMKFAGNGNYIIDNCTFENITATSTKQVVVHLNYGYCEIINSTFEKCSTSYGTLSNYHESNVNNVHMVVRNSTFKNNYANVEPGVINNCGHLTVYDSTFEDNSAAMWAGAIHTHTNANTTVIRSVFKDNLAGWNGGALCTYSYLRVVNSTFVGNNATTNRGGGAIFGFYQGSAPYIIVENCDFVNNTGISGNGGAIIVASGTLIVDDSRFVNNKATATNGGAIASGSSTTTINNCNFTNNYANGKGGAIFAGSAGHLNVYNCQFVNNTASEGNDIAYHYTTKRTNKAFLAYDYNEFWGEDNASGSIYAYDTTYLNVDSGIHNVFHDISEYVDPSEENETGNVVVIPPDKELDMANWNISFDAEDILTGAPVIVGDYILIPANHTLYCYYTNGTYVWDVFSGGAGCFCGLIVENSIVYAPCEGDKLYILDLDTGDSLTNASILEGSSFYAPVMYNNTLYICSENGYGADSNLWITMVKYENGDYVYYDSILEINGVPIYSQAMLSEPIIYGNCLYVNTVDGLVRYNLADNTMTSLAGTIGNPVIDSNGNICVLRNVSGSTYLCLLDSSLNVVDSELLNGDCNQLVSDGAGNVYTVDTNGYIHYASYTGSSISSCSVTQFNVNPVSSAITCDGDYLYIGDDAGILWALKISSLNQSLEYCLEWAFNATSPITGGITVNHDGEDVFIYIGTADGEFYVI